MVGALLLAVRQQFSAERPGQVVLRVTTSDGRVNFVRTGVRCTPEDGDVVLPTP